MSKSVIKPGCVLKRFEETVTMVGSTTSGGKQTIQYRGVAGGRPYETEDHLDQFTHASTCPCRRRQDSRPKLLLKEP